MSTRLDFITPLFVPANRPERFTKAAASSADAIILDLEDAVAAGEKEQARINIVSAFTRLPVIVRINATSTPWHQADVHSVLSAPFTALMLPKAEYDSAFEALVVAACAKGMPVIALIETARGLADARVIAATPGVARLAFGAIDYAADLGMAHTRDTLLHARSELVLAARLARQYAPLDGVTTRIDDENLLSSDARYARDLGFGGKLCIHPRQIGAIFTGFVPDAEEIAWAQTVLSSGEGAVGVEGVMVDEPVRIHARSILQRCRSGDA